MSGNPQKRWNRALATWCVIGCLGLLPSASTLGAPPSSVRLTVEVRWEASEDSAGSESALNGLLLLSQGTIRGSYDPEGGRVLDEGPWRFGGPGAGSRRFRLETTTEAELILHWDAEAPLRIPIVRLLDGPVESPDHWPRFVEVSRVPWDVVEIATDHSGIARPGELLPITIGFNVIAPEVARVDVDFEATVRRVGDEEPVWVDRRRLRIPTNANPPPIHPLSVPAPTKEGTYWIELRTTWTPEPPPSRFEGGRLSRWWRGLRQRGKATSEATRRLRFVVLGSEPAPSVGQGPSRPDRVVDIADLGAGRSLRNRVVSGRRPVEAGASDPFIAPWPIPWKRLEDPNRRDRLRGLIGTVASDRKLLGSANDEGLAWIAAPLRVETPGQAHLLELTVLGGDPEALEVALIEPGEPARLLLDARAAGPMLRKGDEPRTFTFPVWPDRGEVVLLVLNRSGRQEAWLGDARLIERGEPEAPIPFTEPPTPSRSLALRLRSADLERFSRRWETGPLDPVAAARRMGSYLEGAGATGVVWPERGWKRPRGSTIARSLIEDALGPDDTAVALRILKRRGLAVLLERDPEVTRLPGLPAATSSEAIERGLVLVGPSGRPETESPIYNPLNPDVRAALVEFATRGLEREDAPQPDGLVVAIGSGPTLAGRLTDGLDDATYRRFVNEMIKGGEAPGLGTSGPDRFRERSEFVTAAARLPWKRWRAKQVAEAHAAIARAVFRKAPGSSYFVITPSVEGGVFGAEARKAIREGSAPNDAWRTFGLDLSAWPLGLDAPIVLRGVSRSAGNLAHDLATHPVLDEPIRRRPIRGVSFGLAPDPAGARRPATDSKNRALTARPWVVGPEGDEPLGHAVAALDAHWILIDGSAVTGQEARLRGFARTFRSLPEPPSNPPKPPRSGVVVRSASTSEGTRLLLANDTPYPVRVRSKLEAATEATLIDLGLGSEVPTQPTSPGVRSFEQSLPPFGLAALWVEDADVEVVASDPRFDAARDRHHRLVSEELRLLSNSGSIAHLNPRFELPAGVRRASGSDPAAFEAPTAWRLEGPRTGSVHLDPSTAKTGQASLRLEALEPPVLVSSDPFLPPGRTATIRAFVKTDPPNLPIRIRLSSVDSETSPIRLIAELPPKDRSDWTPIGLKAPGLPVDGVSTVRLSFELTQPGRLWVDDLSIQGRGTVQARGYLTAALKAYEEGRYADFARLATSHWVIEAIGPASRALLRTGDASGATALPTRSRLR